MATDEKDNLQKVVTQLAPTISKLLFAVAASNPQNTAGSYYGALGSLLGLIDPRLTNIGGGLGYMTPAFYQGLSTGDWSGLNATGVGGLGGGIASLLGSMVSDEPYAGPAGNLIGQVLGRAGYSAITGTPLLSSMLTNTPMTNVDLTGVANSLGLDLNLNLGNIPLLGIASAIPGLVSGISNISDDPYGAAYQLANTAISTGLAFIPGVGWIASGLFNLLQAIPGVGEFLMEESPYGLGVKGLGDLFSGDLHGLTEMAVSGLLGAPPGQYSQVFGETEAERAQRHAQEQMMIQIADTVNKQYMKYGVEGVQDPAFQKSISQMQNSVGITSMGVPKGDQAFDKYLKNMSGMNIMSTVANPMGYKNMMTNPDKPFYGMPDQVAIEKYNRIAAEQGPESEAALRLLGTITKGTTTDFNRNMVKDYWTEYGAWLADQGLVDAAPSSAQDWQHVLGAGRRGAYKGQDVMNPEWEGYYTQYQNYPYQQMESEALSLSQYLRQNPQYITQTYQPATQNRFATQPTIPIYEGGEWLNEDAWKQIWGNTFYGGTSF